MRFKLIIKSIVMSIFIIGTIQIAYFINFTKVYSIADELTKNAFINNMIILVVMQFILTAIVIFFLPKFLSKMFSDVNKLLKDISIGKFNVDIISNSKEKELLEVVRNIRVMYNELKEFDFLKKAKIIEQNNRLESLFSVTSDAVIIIDTEGKVVGLNTKTREFFPQVQEKINIITANLSISGQKLKKYIAEVLESKSSIDPIQFNIKSLDKHFILKSSIVRDQDSQTIGFVIVGVPKATKKEKKGEGKK